MTNNPLDPELMAILACPECKTDVAWQDSHLVCSQCGRKYPVRDGIPVMLAEEAE